MQGISRMLIQLLEAKRLAERDDEAYGRLALLLLDNLAETIMHRQVQDRLLFEPIWQNLLHQFEQIAAVHPEAAAHRDELKGKVLPKQRRSDIERNFGAKADYLVEIGLLERALARALKKLHQYRNEAYHRDTVRSDSLQTAVDIYLYLACHQLKTYRPHSYAMVPPHPTLRPYIDDEHDMLAGFDLPARVADTLLVERQLDAVAVNARLQEHLLLRIGGVRQTLDTWASETMTPAQLLHNLQVPNDAIRSMDDLLNIGNIPVTHDTASLESWERQARNITPSMDTLEAFGRFADIEDEFEPLEAQVHHVATEMDRCVQEEIDRRRGK